MQTQLLIIAIPIKRRTHKIAASKTTHYEGDVKILRPQNPPRSEFKETHEGVLQCALNNIHVSVLFAQSLGYLLNRK